MIIRVTAQAMFNNAIEFADEANTCEPSLEKICLMSNAYNIDAVVQTYHRLCSSLNGHYHHANMSMK